MKKPLLILGLVASVFLYAQEEKDNPYNRFKDEKAGPAPLDSAPAYGEVIRLNHCAGKYAESVFLCQTKEKRKIRLDSIKPFLQLVNNRKNYNQGTAACHDPGIGVILYNKDNKPVGYYSLCMSCNNIYAKPQMKRNNDVMKTGFSKAARAKLRKIFKQWGFQYIGASQMFESKKDFEKLQKEVEGAKAITDHEKIFYHRTCFYHTLSFFAGNYPNHSRRGGRQANAKPPVRGHCAGACYRG